MNNLKVISFTHKNLSLSDLGNLVVPKEDILIKLSDLKNSDLLEIKEIFYLATCNRVEFVLSTPIPLTDEFISIFINIFYSNLAPDLIYFLLEKAAYFEGISAAKHLFEVSASFESIVIGEREIGRQMRDAYEFCRNLGFTGDLLRLVMKQVVKNAKEIFTNTRIAEKPISVASLAARKLINFQLPFDAPILLIGAGETNTLLTQYLYKKGYNNFTIFNRTLEKAKNLAERINGSYYELSKLEENCPNFDVLITCTSAPTPIITPDIWEIINKDSEHKKILIDLAVPFNIDKKVTAAPNVLEYYSVESLKIEIEENLAFRLKEVEEAKIIIDQNLNELHQILRLRTLEISLGSYPEHIKSIRTNALNEVFAKELNQMDEQSLDLIHRMMEYMEKKCISVPMVLAKQKILNITPEKHRMPGNIKI